MSTFGINDIIKMKSKTDETETVSEYKEIWLSPYQVKPSDSNFYAQENIEELADSFLTVGQQQPTVLARVDGQFWIVSGHRRNRANILNIERGHEEYKQVRYLYKDMSQSMLELSLLMGNAYNRELSAWEKTQQAKRLKEALLRAKKEDGLKIQGKLRDVVAGLMNESSSNVAKMECINNHTVPEIQEAFKKGELGISAAYEAAKLPPEEQKAIAKKTAEGGSVSIKEITGKGKESAGSKGCVEENARHLQTEEEQPTKKISRTEQTFRHKKILREWEEENIGITDATKAVSEAISKVSASNIPSQNHWKDMEWTVFLTKIIMHCADRVSKEDLYLLHDIVMRCQKKEKVKGK